MKYDVFRGQHGTTKMKIHTKLPSITFGDLESAVTYACNPNRREDVVIESIVLSAEIEINNPIISNENDCFVDFSLLIDKLGYEFSKNLAIRFSNSIQHTDNWEENFSEYNNVESLLGHAPKKLHDLYMEIFPLLDDKEFVSFSKKNGFDGAIHMGNGKTNASLEYRVFSISQIQKIKRFQV